MKLKSMMQPAIAYNPRIINSFSQIDDNNFVPISYCSRRFRKILPKLDPDKKDVEIASTITNDNPYIVIIPRIDKNSIENNTRLPTISRRKPMLRITISKIYNVDQESNLTNIHQLQGRECEKNDSCVEHVEIKNYKLNRSVIFSLDPTTGEILVRKRAISTTCMGKFHDNISNSEDSRSEIASPQTVFENLGPNVIRVEKVQ